MNARTVCCLATVASASLQVGNPLGSQSNVDLEQKYAWTENTGWTNWHDADAGNAGVSVKPSFLSGFAWDENVGWINFGDGTPVDGEHYANENGEDFGVNIDPETGDLFGLAWGENIGWLNFDTRSTQGPHNQAGRFELCENRFYGFAWGENIGWVNLDDAIRFIALGPDCSTGDVACDGVIALSDFSKFQDAVSGPNVATDCTLFDTDDDGDVDLDDFGAFQVGFTGD